MEPVAGGGYHGQAGGEVYQAEESSLAVASAEESYEGYEEYEGEEEEYYQGGLVAGVENRVGNTLHYISS